MTTVPQKTSIPPMAGPRSAPIIGPALAGLQLMSDPIPRLQKHYQRYGKLSALTAFKPGKQGLVLAFGAQFNQAILSNPSLFYSVNVDFSDDSALKRLSAGLVNMNGDRHRQQRRLMMPAFHKNAITTYQADMISLTEGMLTHWKLGQTVNLSAELKQLTMKIVSKALFGFDSGLSHEMLGELMIRWAKKASTPASLLLPPLKRQLSALSNQLEVEINKIIAQKREAISNQQDVLSTLITAHDEDNTRLTDSELIGHTMVLFLAGHETTLNVLLWILLLLSQHPTVRHELMDELNSVLHGDAPTPEQVGELKVLDRVIKESMRLLPPAIYAMRYATEPFELGGYPMAKNSGVIISHFITHRLPDVFGAHPDRFLPARWESIEPTPYEYLPFSAGPRMCIGTAFASLEIRTVLSMILQRFQLSFTPNARIDYQVTGNILSPKTDLQAVLYTHETPFDQMPLKGRITELIRI